VGKQLFYANEVGIVYFMRSAVQAPLLFLSGSLVEFRCMLIHDV